MPDPILPSLDKFEYTAEQRAAIMDALKDFVGQYKPAAEDSPVAWYYGQAYSLGLIQAAQLIGQERPILDIIKNQEVFQELTNTGFDLVKDNATRAIVNQILPEMEAHVIAGSNPLVVAERLKKLFGSQNSNWNRLARTEMTMAAEQAKRDEWQAWGEKEAEFMPAPDGCAICQALRGIYPIRTVPIPGRNTHPHCRCSIRPVVK